MKPIRFALITIIAILASMAMPAVAASAHDSVSIETASQCASVKVVAGQVYIDIYGDTTKNVVVYALTGQVVKNIQLQPGTNIIDLPKGYYIVKVDKYTQKVVIK